MAEKKKPVSKGEEQGPKQTPPVVKPAPTQPEDGGEMCASDRLISRRPEED